MGDFAGIFLTLFCSTLAVAIVLTPLICRVAEKNDLMDVPNQRSSHVAPTPSGGGIAIIASWLLVLIVLSVFGHVRFVGSVAIVPPTLMMAIIGYLDDRRGLSRSLRITCQLVAVCWYIFFSGGVPTVGIEWLDARPILRNIFGALSLIWLINLFNFMDGIDGIAASEAIFVALGIVFLSWLGGGSGVDTLGVALAGGSLGFLIWNWPPARIFMGDVGSSALGFLLGAIALDSSARTGISIWPWVILLGVFLTDATVTLLRRLGSGERWYEPHCSHAYQRLARKWGGHQPVTLFSIAVNLLWLLPCAVWAMLKPIYAPGIVAFALAPLIGAWLFVGAGHSESS